MDEFARSMPSVKAGSISATRLSSSPATRTGKTNEHTKHRATGSLSTSSHSSSTPSAATTQLKSAAKGSVKRQSKSAGKSAGGSASKISKTVSRVRQLNAQQMDTPLLSSAISVSKLVVSYPITSIPSDVTPLPPSIPMLTTVTVSSSAPTTPYRPLPHSSKPTSSLYVSSVGGVQVTTISTTNTATTSILPITSAKKMGRGSSTSSSSSSSSSSGSDSRESGSDSSSSTDEDEEMQGVSGPVRLVSTVTSSSDLPCPKAILSPIMLTAGGSTSSSPLGAPIVSPVVFQSALVSPRQTQAQAAFTSWTQSPCGPEGGVPPSSSSSIIKSATEFLPLAPPLSSSTSLPFSSLSKPGSGGSAFQVFSPKQQMPQPQPSVPPAVSSPEPMQGCSPVLALSAPSTSTVSVIGKGLCINSSHS